MPILLITYALALGVRLAYLAAHAGDPLFAYPMVDSAVYFAAAERWAAGGGLPDGALAFGPLYPIVLGTLHKLTGGSAGALHALQMAIEATGAPLVYLITRRVAGPGGATAGLLAAVLYALYWPFVYYSGEWLVEPVLIPLLLGALLLWLRASDAGAGASRASATRGGANAPRAILTAAGAGALLGLSSIARPNGLLVLALVTLTTIAWQRRYAAGAAIALAGALVVLPVAARNHAESGDWILVSSTGGINFYIGNNPYATGRDSTFPGMRQWTFAKVEALAELETGRPLSAAEVSAHYFAKGRDFVLKSPGAFLGLTARKLATLFADYEMPNVKDPNFYRARSPFLRLPVFAGFGVVLALAVAGVFGTLANRHRTSHASAGTKSKRARGPSAPALTLLFAGFYALSVVLFFVNARYRLPVVPFLLPFAALGLVALARALRDDRARLARNLAIVAGVLALAGWNPLGALGDESQSWFNVGWAAQKSGRTDEALEAYARVSESNNWYPLALHNRALIERDAGKLDEALRDLESALAIDSTYYEAWATLGGVHYRREAFDEAARAYARAAALWPQATYHVNHGLALRNTGALGRSLAAFDRAISLDPSFVKARAHRTEILIAQGAYAGAAQELETILTLDPGNEAARTQLAAIRRQLDSERARQLDSERAGDGP